MTEFTKNHIESEINDDNQEHIVDDYVEMQDKNESHANGNNDRDQTDNVDKSTSNLNDSISKSLVSYKNKTSNYPAVKNQKIIKKTNKVQNFYYGKSTQKYGNSVTHKGIQQSNTSYNHNQKSVNTIIRPNHTSHLNKSDIANIPNNYINFDHKFNVEEFCIATNYFSIKPSIKKVVQTRTNSTRSNKNKITLYREEDIQTEITLNDIDRIVALNQEYNQQLITYQHDLQEQEMIYNKKLKEILNENEKSNVTEYIPELIPPEDTFKIFLCKSLYFKLHKIV